MRIHLPVRILLPFVILLVALAGSSCAQVGQPPATIYLIRHAEKLTDGQPDLSPVGFRRAATLPALFAPSGVEHNQPPLPVPQVLFATRLSKHSNRPVETITPLSAALHLPIYSDFLNEDYAGLARELLGGKYAGKIVLVAWHHGTLPQLAILLGAKPPYVPWPEMQFDRIWRIDYTDGKATLTDLPQQLMPGDSK